jgi:hypothetical protein
MSRVMAGFHIAPAVTTTVATIIYGDYWFFGIALFLAYLFTFLFGLPMFLLFRKLRWLALWQVACGAIVPGLLSSLLLFSPSTEYFKQQGLQSALGVTVYAVITAVIFWFIGVRGNLTLTRHSSGTPNGAP